MEFNPPILSRTTNELIEIAHYPEDWNPLAVKHAKKELAERGVSTEEQRRKVEAWERQAKIEHQKELQQRAIKSFGIFDLVWMALKWPKTILWDWNLKKEGYHRKHKERLYAIGAGMLCTIGLVLWLTHDAEISRQKWKNEVNRQDIYEWEKSHYTQEEIIASRKEAIEKAILTIQENKSNGTSTLLIVDKDTIIHSKIEKLKAVKLSSIRDVIFQNSFGSNTSELIIIKLNR